MIKKYLLVLSLLIIFPFFNVNSLQSAGGSSFSLDLVSQYGEGGLYVKNVVIDGNYLYTKNFEGHNIEILDISDVQSLQLVDTINALNSYGGSVQIDRDRDILFYNEGKDKIVARSITDPNDNYELNSVTLNQLQEDSELSSLKLLDDNILLAIASWSLHLYDVSDIDDIQLLGSYVLTTSEDINGCLSDFAILNDRYFFSHRVHGLCWPWGEWGAYLIDLDNPSSPAFTKSVSEITNKTVFKGDYGYTYEVHHDGSNYDNWYDEVVFYDFSDLNNIQEIDRIQLQQGDTAQISNVGIWNDKYLFYARSQYLTVFDITDPSSPVLLIQEYDTRSNFGVDFDLGHSIIADDNYIYSALSRNGVLIFSYQASSTPISPDSCTENDWTYRLDPEACSSSEVQTKVWSKKSSCSGGVTHSNEQVSCLYSQQITNEEMFNRLKGKIILKVEENGEAYYLNPQTRVLHYLGRPDDAFTIMREQGVGITSADLQKITIGFSELTGTDADGDNLQDIMEDAVGTNKNSTDSDGDGYGDKTELENGFNPLLGGGARMPLDSNFSARHLGKIFLQVENNGEAWYIHLGNSKRYFLGRPADAFDIMRNLGLGISNTDFNQLIN